MGLTLGAANNAIAVEVVHEPDVNDPEATNPQTLVEQQEESRRWGAKFSGGRWHSAAVTGEGRVVCCGFNGDGQCRVPDGLEKWWR
jgi:alpha-tubulin suppressor-like RCC1 family protein